MYGERDGHNAVTGCITLYPADVRGAPRVYGLEGAGPDDVARPLQPQHTRPGLAHGYLAVHPDANMCRMHQQRRPPPVDSLSPDRPAPYPAPESRTKWALIPTIHRTTTTMTTL